MDNWSYSTGRRGVSRVRVYERYPGSPIQIERTGHSRETLTNMLDEPVIDRNLAMKIANRLSERMEEGHRQRNLRKAFGIRESRTLSQLLTRYHQDKEPNWSEKHRLTQRSIRDWWLGQLGKDTQLSRINEAWVERVVNEHGREHDWSRRTRQKYLRYLLAAFRYGRRKLKWIAEEEDLTAVDVPKASRGGPSYDRPDLMAMMKKAADVDWRVDLALHIAYDAVARSKAVIHLRADDYLGDGVLRFRKEYDKAGKERIVPLSPTTTWKLEAALRRPDVQKTGWLLPGDIKQKRPIRYDQLLELLNQVEAAADVEKVEDRGWHGVKRRATTDAREVAAKLGVSAGAVAGQAGTREDTLADIYYQQDMEPKRKLVAGLEALRTSS